MRLVAIEAEEVLLVDQAAVALDQAGMDERRTRCDRVGVGERLREASERSG